VRRPPGGVRESRRASFPSVVEPARRIGGPRSLRVCLPCLLLLGRRADRTPRRVPSPTPFRGSPPPLGGPAARAPARGPNFWRTSPRRAALFPGATTPRRSVRPRSFRRAHSTFHAHFSTGNPPSAQGGLRATEAINPITCPHPGHRGGGPGGGGTSAGARQSSSAAIRSRLACAAAPSHP